MKEHFIKIAQGLEDIAEGLRAIAHTENKKDKEVNVDWGKETHCHTDKRKTVTVEEVRAVLAEKSRDGKTDAVKELLNQFGAEKLSSVPEDRLAELLDKAGGL
ncbi:hypothetical protein [Anaeromicropila populeti]|uniref:rRNA biogenesis protein rrp5 n=1 Tax=Anaeromicropila populeti TaxID=37658 RepID=A0A1I6LDM6_9FIRM|nr:hypothetical protein [Anaeromicropila populeti]SFS01547.1 hypothetical protein SAMN05661086_03240 [Anaeromicropila populeti]